MAALQCGNFQSKKLVPGLFYKVFLFVFTVIVVLVYNFVFVDEGTHSQYPLDSLKKILLHM